MVYKRKCNLQEQNLKLLHYICEEDLTQAFLCGSLKFHRVSQQTNVGCCSTTFLGKTRKWMPVATILKLQDLPMIIKK